MRKDNLGLKREYYQIIERVGDINTLKRLNYVLTKCGGEQGITASWYSLAEAEID